MASMVYQLYLQMKAGKKPRIFKDGEQKRDFVYIKDVLEATLAASVAYVPGVYNVESGSSSSFNDVISRLNKVLGLALNPEYFENTYPFYQNVTQADMSKSREKLCYEPRFDLQHGIDDYVKWLLKSGES